MNLLKNAVMLMTFTLLLIVAPVGFSASDPAERKADQLEDKADQIRKNDEKARDALEKRGEAEADRKGRSGRSGTEIVRK